MAERGRGAAMRTKCLKWGPRQEASLQALLARLKATGRLVTFAAFGGARKVSEAGCMVLACEIATACRCGEAHTVEQAPEPTPSANPLRAIREAANLSQAQAANLMGWARRTWQIKEASATAKDEDIAKARFVMGGG